LRTFRLRFVPVLFLFVGSLFLDSPGRAQDKVSREKPDETFQRVNGEPVSLAVPEGGALALVFLWTECPISNQFSPTLIQLANDFEGKPVRMVGFFVDADKSDEEVAEHAGDYDLNFPIVRLKGVRFPRQLGVSVVPSTVVFNDQDQVVYQGRISDLFYDLGKRRQVSQTQNLRDALHAVLAGEAVAAPCVEAIGCTLPDFGTDD
jgi:thiol-disulfide isomerase/thioredoxin